MTQNLGAKGFRAKISGWGARAVYTYSERGNGNRKTKSGWKAKNPLVTADFQP